MLQINGKIDDNDLAFIIERYGFPVASMPCPVGKGNKINPHVSRFLLKSGQIADVFHSKPIYYETHDRKWRPLGEVLEHHGNHRMVLKPDWDKRMHPRFLQWLIKRQAILNGNIFIPSPYQLKEELIALDFNKIYFTTTTVYPQPSTGAGTADGSLTVAAVSTWALARDAANAQEVNMTATTHFLARSLLTGGTYYNYRVGFTFDTSGIPDTDTIDSATMNWRDATTDLAPNTDADVTSVVLVQFSPADVDSFATSDYTIGVEMGTTSLGSKTIASITADAYNAIDINATGLALISKTGITGFGTMTERDRANAAPTGDNRCGTYSADQAGTDKDPKLIVIHSAGGAPEATVTRRRFIRH